jgi:hypothetical protein
VLVILFLVAASVTVTVLVAKDLQVETFTIHFEAFGFLAVASDLLNFLNLQKPLLPFPLFVDVHPPKCRWEVLINLSRCKIFVSRKFYFRTGRNLSLLAIFHP